MSAVYDLKFLLGKIDEMKELGHIIGVEAELQQFRRAVESARVTWATALDYRHPWILVNMNESANELLEKIWCWHERHRRISSLSSVVKVVDVVARFWNKIIFGEVIASELKELTRYYLRETDGGSADSDLREVETLPKLEAPDGIIGRDKDVENIVTRIVQLRQQVLEDDRKLRMITIVGMPGIGKTTVANMVYSHPSVEQNFDLRIWVDVSSYFDHKRVLRRMENIVLGTVSGEDDEDSIHDILKEELMGRRYLLVLDGVWKEDPWEWGSLKKQLLDISGAQGTVIVTTSSQRIAEMMMTMMADNSDPAYELQGTPTPKRLEQWNNSLSRRYERLPIHLRHCFQFCSFFPGEHSYDVEEVTEIWLALRYANHAQLTADSFSHNSAHQAIYKMHYAELWDNFFFRNRRPEHSTDDKVTYKMHYSMHQVAKHLDTRLFPVAKHLKHQSPETRLHLILIVHSQTSEFPKDLSQSKNLKTLILLREPQVALLNHRCKISRIPPHLFERLKYLCVLDLQYTMINKLPLTVVNLLNLRHLNLSGTRIAIVPGYFGKLRSLMFLKLVNCKYLRKLNDAVAELVNLEKLDVAGCHCLVGVPDRIDNMRQLRCINIKECSSMTQMPRRLGQFTNLHTLPRYVVAENDGYRINELKILKRLEGELRIENLQKVAKRDDAADAQLWNKTMIKSLTLQWKWWKHAEEEIKSLTTDADEDVLEALRPNKNVIKLEIISFMGKQFPSWIIRVPPYLYSLEEIKLINIKQCQVLPPLGFLPRLRVAEISGMDAVTEVDGAFFGGDDGIFRSLRRLTFSQMLNLIIWFDVGRGNVLPHLTSLTFIHCPKMVALEMELPSVTELTLWLDNEGLYSSKGGLKGLTTSLKKLSISLCQQLLESSDCLGLQELRALEEMEISGCQELTNLPRGIRRLNSMKSLTIVGCNKMRASPNWSKDELTFLRSLAINGVEFAVKQST